jgi:hypothetical protein
MGDDSVTEKDSIVASLLRRMGVPSSDKDDFDSADADSADGEGLPPVDDTEIEALDATRRKMVFEAVARVIDPELKAVVKNHGLLEVLNRLAVDGRISGFERSRMLALWEQPAVDEWLREHFRALSPACHEWIPTNLMRQVFDRTAARQGDWIGLQHALRSPTGDVIFSYAKVPETVVENGQRFVILNGHVGAVYYRNEAQTVKQGPFHDELRARFHAARSLQACAGGLQAVMRDWLWSGDPHEAPLHRELCETRERRFDIDRLIRERRSVFQGIDAMFTRWAGR